MSRPIFLLSLPRAGSTLVQRLLLADGRCATLGEPGLLLRLLGNEDHAMVRRATYWESLVEAARTDMRAAWPGFDAAYRLGVADLMRRIYAGLAGDKAWFLDKTPRYTLIAEEIFQTFPEAKFIVLWRHPLAVAASICSTYRGGRWCPEEFEIDLCEGLDRLHQFSRDHRGAICEIRYENLVADPGPELEKLGAYLGWDHLEEVAQRALPESAGGSLGDPTGVARYRRISPDSRDAWIGQIDNWYRRRWCRRYWTPERAARLAELDYHLPEDFAQNAGLAAGLADCLVARHRIRRRIKNPTWLPRFSRQFRKTRGYGVLFR